MEIPVETRYLNIAPLPTDQAKSPPIPRPMGRASCFTAPDIVSIAQRSLLSNFGSPKAKKISAFRWLRRKLRVLRKIAAEIRQFLSQIAQRIFGREKSAAFYG
ncbi:hypothetical protein [Sphingobium sp. EM0848]|uniref:hypothetical protein n=1 Tax=Sphingobium sp. EM0848 TaxID=2743473 RepID=UPI00159C513B|nr:hypothetical protein [Sphingobium sp. EM0848]